MELWHLGWIANTVKMIWSSAAFRDRIDYRAKRLRNLVAETRQKLISCLLKDGVGNPGLQWWPDGVREPGSLHLVTLPSLRVFIWFIKLPDSYDGFAFQPAERRNGKAQPLPLRTWPGNYTYSYNNLVMWPQLARETGKCSLSARLPSG